MKILLIVILVSFTLNLNGQDSTGYISPKPTGPWNVGRQVVEWIDSSRIDIIDSTQYRTIPVFVWYSAIVNDTIIPEYPLDEDWRNEQVKYLLKKMGAGASEFLSNLKVWSIPNAQPVSGGQKFPVLIFGPGHTWLPTDYSILIEEIVSYGYIVVGYVPTGFPGVTKLAKRKNNKRQFNSSSAGY